ncbi:MAG: helicase [Proteobacteria bacterium]|nr:MAG: helicase [Pseudomonadota bacterium]
MGMDYETRTRNVTAVLGPTNTGKTHLAIERMLGHETGMIGLPLRLLAREVYDKIVARVGKERVALVTGEEKIKPDNPRYWVCTVEAMPREIDVDFLAIDEIQLAADPERGHVFTDRLLHARGKLETLLLGAATMREAIADLIPGANFISRPRLSKLSYAGQKKITRLPPRTAVVAFSANDVYAIAELIRRQRGGAAVVLGALSPRTRNAQVALYQSGDVDFLVATDAIGMGLNLTVDHVAFASIRKFDGQTFRDLTPAELAQIAGRAGRHLNDGTFGVTGDVEPFDSDLIERLETHTFDTVKVLQWRNRKLDFSSIDALRESLRAYPTEPRLTRARMAEDVIALENVSNDREILDMVRGPAATAMLWDVCQVPDYRKISSQSHAELVATLFKFLMTGEERIPEDWFAKQVEMAARTDGDIDTLANRIAHIRTWTFVSNRPNWLRDPEHWRGRTREIEDSLSDALHEQLTLRFVDQRTSALMRGMRDKEELTAEISEDGSIHVENHYVGRLKGFIFTPDAQAEGIHGKAARTAAAQVLSRELAMRVRRITAAKNDAFKLSRNGRILWRGEEVARLEPGDHPLKPQLVLLADEHLQAPDREKVQERLTTWLNDTIRERLKPLVELSEAQDVTGLARGIAFQLTENFGVLKRETVAEEMKSLDQNGRAQLRRYGVRFGAFNIYFPLLLKPAPAELTLVLWALKHAGEHNLSIDALPEPPRAGLTSARAEPGVPEAFYRACGYHVCGPRAVRIDILERLADLIRPLLAWRPDPENPSAQPPKGSTGDGGFVVIPEMMSILGCSPEELGAVLTSLGFRSEKRPVKRQPTVAQAGAEATAAAPAEQGTESETPEEPPASDEASVQKSAADQESIGELAAEPDATPAEGESEISTEEVRAESNAVTETEPPAAAQEDSGTEQQAEVTAVDAPAETSSETIAAETDSAPQTSAEAVEEIKYEEVWRPRRKHEGSRQDRHRKRHRHDGERRDARQDRRPHQHRDKKPGAAAASASTPQQSGPANQQQQRDRKDDRRDGKRRDDRRRHHERRPIQMHAAPPPKRGEVDPDSPFAALSALKKVLEKQSAEDSGSS